MALNSAHEALTRKAQESRASAHKDRASEELATSYKKATELLGRMLGPGTLARFKLYQNDFNEAQRHAPQGLKNQAFVDLCNKALKNGEKALALLPTTQFALEGGEIKRYPKNPLNMALSKIEEALDHYTYALAFADEIVSDDRGKKLTETASSRVDNLLMVIRSW